MGECLPFHLMGVECSKRTRLEKEIEKLRAELARARSEARDLERENASLRRRLREGGR
jgi:regulator of replication initiation timing